jgi:homocysteine S-methyltransferase
MKNMNNKIGEILDKWKICILDGGLATEIQDRGYDLNDELWSAKILIENPGIIEQVHYDYFLAGADVAITASYQASIEGFKKRGYSPAEAENFIRLSVEVAQKARKRFWDGLSSEERRLRAYPLIAGSVGPYAAYFADGSESRPYKAGITRHDFISYHLPRMDILIKTGVDIIAAETLPSLEEAEAILEILKNYPGVYAWISFHGETDHAISEGTAIVKCAQVLDAYEQAAAIGINCTYPQHVSSLIQDAEKNTSKPIVAYPNAGDVFDEETKEWHRLPHHHDFGELTEAWYNMGARVIGGCCRTTPADIRAISQWARKYREQAAG